jgi:hypothetical protein
LKELSKELSGEVCDELSRVLCTKLAPTVAGH